MRYIIVAVILMSSALFAGHPLVTDDSYTIGEKRWQLEFTPEYFRSKVERELHLPLVTTYGLNEKLDVVVSLPYCVSACEEEEWKTTTNFETPALELKWNIWQRKEFFLAVKPGLGISFDGKVELLSEYFIQSIETEKIVFHFNQGFMYNRVDGEEKFLWHLSTALEFPVAESINWVMNLGVEKSPEQDADIHPAFIIQGVQYVVNDFITLDIGFRAGLNQGENYLPFLTGVTILK